ncbi:MAG: hypothetical protein WA821_11325 [Anaerolineales bacterium]
MPSKMNSLLQRLPARTSIVSVYAVICFLVYSWTILIAFWKFPSWIYDLTIDEIIGINAYAFTVNLFESVFVLGILLFLCVILPASFLKNDFTVRATIILVCLLGSAMLHLYVNRDGESLENFIGTMQIWWASTLVVLAVLLGMSIKVQRLRAVVANIADRLIILLYVFMPLSLMSVVIVILRNVN